MLLLTSYCFWREKYKKLKLGRENTNSRKSTGESISKQKKTRKRGSRTFKWDKRNPPSRFMRFFSHCFFFFWFLVAFDVFYKYARSPTVSKTVRGHYRRLFKLEAGDNHQSHRSVPGDRRGFGASKPAGTAKNTRSLKRSDGIRAITQRKQFLGIPFQKALTPLHSC